MSKNAKKIVMLVFIMILSFFEVDKATSSANSDLYLDPDSLYEQNEAESSLTDRYNIPLFTDEYSEKVKIEEKERKISKDNLIKEVFLYKEDMKINEMTFIDKYSKKYNIFYKKIDLEKHKDTIKEDKKTFWIIVGITLVACEYTYLVTNRYYKRRREMRLEKEND